MRQEATSGVLDVGGAYATQVVTGFTPDPIGGIVTNADITGRGTVNDKRTNLTGLNLTTGYTLKYNNLRLAVAAAMRSVFPVETTIVGSGDINFETGVVFQDGSTSANHGRLTAPTTSFDNLITYGGAVLNGAEGLMLTITGANISTNDGKRRIHAVYDTGALAVIEFMIGYTTLASPSGFGAPITADTLDSPTLRVGSAVRDVGCGPNFNSYSALWQFCEMINNGKWQSGVGLRANDLSINWTGKDAVTVDVTWIGQFPNLLVAADPTGQGVTDAALGKYPMMIGGSDLKTFALTPIDPTGAVTGPVEMSGFNLTSLASTKTGGVTPVTNISGNEATTGVRPGVHDPGVTVGWDLGDDPRAEQIVSLGHFTTRQKVTADALFEDTLGNGVEVGWLACEPSPTMPVPGTTGTPVSGTLELGAHELSQTSGQMIWQELVAV
jgi:hypothetical protein